MLESAGELGAIAAELSDIRLLLIAVLAVTALSACLGILKAASTGLRPLLSLTKRPNHVYAHWYLARAYYLQEKWADSLAEFREVARLDPTWIEDHVKPYVSAIERKAAADTIH